MFFFISQSVEREPGEPDVVVGSEDGCCKGGKTPLALEKGGGVVCLGVRVLVVVRGGKEEKLLGSLEPQIVSCEPVEPEEAKPVACDPVAEPRG